MAKTIKKLTDEQLALMPVFADRWLKIGLCCDPLDFEGAQEAAGRAYKVAGLEAPLMYFRSRSPMEGALVAVTVPHVLSYMLDHMGVPLMEGDDASDPAMPRHANAFVDDFELGTRIYGKTIRDESLHQTPNAWFNAMCIAMDVIQVTIARKAMECSHGTAHDVLYNVATHLAMGETLVTEPQEGVTPWAQGKTETEVLETPEVQALISFSRSGALNEITGLSKDQVSQKLLEAIREQVHGSHDAGWLSFYSFFLEACNLELCRDLEPLMNMAERCGWWAPYRGFAIFQDRHSELHRDEQGRLHNMEGAAVLYPDGFGVWAVHGVRVPRYVIEEPEKITFQDIEKEENAEVRRVMTDRYGPARYIEDSGLKPFHQDDFGALYRRDQPNDEALVMVKLVNSTAEPDGTFKDYWLRVPPTMKTAKEAVAWTFGMKEDEYAPLMES